MKQIVTVTLNHICPMVTGVTPHMGGPIIGPGCPGVLVDGTPVSLMGDACVCCGPPDMIAQGYPGVMVDGVPVVVQNCMTAHGGVIPVGVPGVVIGSAPPIKPITMNIRKIPFPKIRTVDSVGAAVTGNSKKMKEAKNNIAELKKETSGQTPMIYNLRWEKEGVRLYSDRIDEGTKMVADVTNIPDGDTVKISVLIDEDNRIVKQFEGTVKNGTVEIDWDILSKHFKKEE